MTPPSPIEVDQLAKEYKQLKDRLFEAKLAQTEIQQKLDLKAKHLLELVRLEGSGHRDKSYLLYGVEWEIMGTFGQQLMTDSLAVEQFRAAAKKELKPKQFSQMFEELVTYRLLSTASDFVRNSKLSRKLGDLFARCQMIKDKTPTLTVRPRSKSAA